jgi:hypothetical protein
MAKKRKPQGKSRSKARRRRHGFWYRLFRALFRRVKRRAKTRWSKIKKAFEPKVVKNYKRDGWRDQFPDPRKPPPFSMKKAESEEYIATFDSALDVPFTIWPDSNASVRDAALDAAEAVHGPIVQSWTLTYIEAVNDAAKAAYPQGVPW